jgi:response regulator RpfG family c-di-GMP phosphodiesterase
MEKFTILLVDDDPALLDSFALRLSLSFNVETAATPQEAMAKLSQSKTLFDVAVIDMWMDDDPMAGLKLIDRIKKELTYPPECVVLTAYGKIETASACMEIGAFAFVEKGREETNRLLEKIVEKAANHCKLNRQRQSKTILSNLSKAFIRIIENRDPFEFRRSQRVTRWAVSIGQSMDLSDQQLIDIEIGAMLHDIGKALISEYIVMKPGRMTETEQKTLEEHPIMGYELMKDVPSISDDILMIIMHHHERYDGSGYPKGLKDDEIPILAKIVGLACDFEHSFSPATNRAIREPERAKAQIITLTQEGKLDPVVADHFLRLYEKGKITQVDMIRQYDELFALAVQEVKAHQYIQARRYCDDALGQILRESDIFGAAFCVASGDLFFEALQYKDASDYYKRASQLRPGFAEAFYKRGLAFEKQQMWERADWYYAVATKLIPSYVEAHLSRGQTLYKGGFSDEAMKCFDRALSLHPNCPTSYLGKGRIFHDRWQESLESEHNKRQAQNNYERALALMQTYETLSEEDKIVVDEIIEALNSLSLRDSEFAT